MNKEAKAIVEYLEEEREAIRTKCYYPDDILNCEDLIMLMDYINQLETNRDDAIDFIDIYTDGINLEAFDCLELMYKVKEILERGKE